MNITSCNEVPSLIAFHQARPVRIRTDKTVVFDRVVQVLDVAKKTGVERLGIAVEEKPPPITSILKKKWPTQNDSSFLLFSNF